MRFRAIFLVPVLLLLLSACSTKPKLAEGRCERHSDCAPGQQCIKTYCEDLYHPRKDIKPF